MSIKTYKPTTPSRRHMSVSGFDGIDKKAKPERSLVEVLKKHSGRNSYGRITVRHKGGGNRRKYRIIDFKRDKMDMEDVYKRQGLCRFFGRSARLRPPAPCARVGLWLSFVRLGAFASARWVSARPYIYLSLIHI